jgi:hypothetical protein
MPTEFGEHIPQMGMTYEQLVDEFSVEIIIIPMSLRGA